MAHQLIFLLMCVQLNLSIQDETRNNFKTQPTLINADFNKIFKPRELFLNVNNFGVADRNMQVQIFHLNQKHANLSIHRLEEYGNIVCIATDPNKVSPNVYFSYDYGYSYQNKTESLKLPNGSYAEIVNYYQHPTKHACFLLIDLKNKMIFSSANYGENIKRINVTFTPSFISFHKYRPETFLALDNNELWLTDNFGQNWKLCEINVKSFFWIGGNDEQLVIQRLKTNGLSTILSSTNLSVELKVFVDDVEDLYIKEDYLFFSKKSSKDDCNLYVSYQLRNKIKCSFSTKLDKRAFYVADVTSDRALVVINHNDTLFHLYVSENLKEGNEEVHFSLSLESVFCYFPNNSWNGSWLSYNDPPQKEAFADVYKVRGLEGVYIASQLISRPHTKRLGPEHLASKITFDFGSFWQFIEAPQRDAENEPINCSRSNNCSLHLTQKFNYLHLRSQTPQILSNKAAPGIILATGVAGKSLKGEMGVYVSCDGGFTWKHVTNGLHDFNIGFRGGILMALEKTLHPEKPRHLLYSHDGKTWETMEFSVDLKVHNLLIEPFTISSSFTSLGFHICSLHRRRYFNVRYNGGSNLTDRSDDINCFNKPCLNNEFLCKDGRCIPNFFKCNGESEFKDGSDEMYSPNKIHSNYSLTCKIKQCSAELKYERLKDSDEPSCIANASSKLFSYDLNQCVRDEIPDCWKGSYEKICTSTYQFLQIGVDERASTKNSLKLIWRTIPAEFKFKLLFLIKKVGAKHGRFSQSPNIANLKSYTKYNITIYARENTTKKTLLSQHIVATTKEGVPSKPWNVTAEQYNGSHVLVSWNKPSHPNGQIQNYKLLCIPLILPGTLLTVNETSHFITAEFRPNTTYSFYVSAFNRLYQSRISEVERIVIDGKLVFDRVTNLQVTNVTNNSISLTWNCYEKVDGFKIKIDTTKSWLPKLNFTTTGTNITVNDLVPGMVHMFQIRAFNKSHIGLSSTISVTTGGSPIPEVNILSITAIENHTVEIVWRRPNESSDVNWIYSVNFGKSAEESCGLLTTTDLSAIITNLSSCDRFYYSVRIVGPLGLGPISQEIFTITPPTVSQLNVTQDPDDDRNMIVRWRISCYTNQPVAYFIMISPTNMVYVFKATGCGFYRPFPVRYGVIYEIKVATSTDLDAALTVVYIAPPPLPGATLRRKRERKRYH